MGSAASREARQTKIAGALSVPIESEPKLQAIDLTRFLHAKPKSISLENAMAPFAGAA
jgi:hypothetical protein